MKLSCVISAFDHHDITAVHVREMMNATVMPDEIIVVNDGGTPDLLDKLKKLEKKTKIIYARIKENIEWNYNGACNLGFYLSTGDFVGFEDNDNIPHKDFYQQALDLFKTVPEIGRITGELRLHINTEDLKNPVEEWKITGTRGPNQGTCIMRRELFLKVKGYDERFCGRYGWMYYDWKHRLLVGAGTTFGSIGQFYYVVDGQSNLKRKLEKENYRHYRINAVEKRYQPQNILNFGYEFQVL
ncbi:MAG TPA: glycosyltransferase family 2 protein [bacterium]|nr:glycosyltransferase family 2 protein [bacterium]